MEKAELIQLSKVRNPTGQVHSAMKYPAIYVFKTNVREIIEGRIIIRQLHSYLPGSEVSFDLGDCDKVLRIKHYGNFAAVVIAILNEHGFNCEELLD